MLRETSRKNPHKKHKKTCQSHETSDSGDSYVVEYQGSTYSDIGDMFLPQAFKVSVMKPARKKLLQRG